MDAPLFNDDPTANAPPPPIEASITDAPPPPFTFTYPPLYSYGYLYDAPSYVSYGAPPSLPPIFGAPPSYDAPPSHGACPPFCPIAATRIPTSSDNDAALN